MISKKKKITTKYHLEYIFKQIDRRTPVVI